ncbi:hypothetical protein [Algoriphagus sp.]|jgi:hypothetical protein|uniref:hypothetical protein n=1 Tax=Algoriphagus sp. TaxID=1872435 RepID=UPI002727F168|nr:hypothetical protein [Algoriphagus sp.]MDO8968690.1 hypothetical protein [Algoriphagus sp.]MDP3200288.1 hypothetical protein [Algoriphagus sp.]
MKRFFIGAAFFWACTFTQQAQHPSSESHGEDKTAWAPHLMASVEKSDSQVTPHSIQAYDRVLARKY